MSYILCFAKQQCRQNVQFIALNDYRELDYNTDVTEMIFIGLWIDPFCA